MIDGFVGIGCSLTKNCSLKNQISARGNFRNVIVHCSSSHLSSTDSKAYKYEDDSTMMIKRRELIGLVLGSTSFFVDSFNADGAGLPPEEKPKLCDDGCEKELENVWWAYRNPTSTSLLILHFGCDPT